jgi:hypothetical protein
MFSLENQLRIMRSVSKRNKAYMNMAEYGSRVLFSNAISSKNFWYRFGIFNGRLLSTHEQLLISNHFHKFKSYVAFRVGTVNHCHSTDAHSLIPLNFLYMIAYYAHDLYYAAITSINIVLIVLLFFWTCSATLTKYKLDKKYFIG